jgi:uncharacterized membrane protein YedE/YeeE
MEILTKTWPWYVAGPLIGLMVPLLLLMGNRQFGISGSIRDFVAVIFRKRQGYFAYEPEKNNWRLWFAVGIVAAGLVLSFLPGPEKAGIGVAAQTKLASQGVTDQSGLYPTQLLGGENGFSLTQVLFCIIGGLLVGFGTRYAGGCTSGHSIMGLSQLSGTSLLATIAFFAGGLLMTHLIYPYLLPTLLQP